MNMQAFMISIKFLPQYRQEILATLPQERARANDEIVEAWFSYDALGLLQQLGAIPAASH